MSKTLKYILIFMVISVFANVFLSKRTNTTPSQASSVALPLVAPVTTPSCDVAKKDGSMDERKCDLQELCKDWVFFRRKIVEYAQVGNEVKAAEARARFKQTNYWLSAYREEDVSSCLRQNGG